MIKHVFAYLLIITLLANSLQAIVIFTTFKINQDFISEVFCINKNNKEIPDCKGSCYLKEQLSKTADQPNQDVNYAAKIKDLLQIVQEYPPLEQHYSVQHSYLSFYSENISLSNYISDIYHPPRL